jgi:hypothetical protein
MGLSTASLLLPVFFAREFLGVEKGTPLKNVLGCSVYWSWALLGLAIFSGIVFHFLSAKWARLAWEQKAGIFGFDVSKNTVEGAMNVFFWVSALAFMVGLALVIGFFVTYEARS